MKLLRHGLLIAFLHVVVFKVAAQQRVVIGNVRDAQTNEPVSFAVVYINNTANATETDEKGGYVLKNVFNHVRGGSVEMVVSSLGYTTFRQKISDSSQDTLRLDLVLASRAIVEVSVKGKRDKQWERQYRKFEDAFLGRNENARKSKILNPWVVDFEGDNNEFSASSSKIIEVENKPLGYKIFFELQRFALSPMRSSFAGLARFEEIKITDAAQKEAVETRRQKAYEGSERHFFKALAEKRLKQEGFVVYEVNPNYNEKNSFSHLNPQLGKRLLPLADTTTVRAGRFPFSKEIIAPNELEILNTNTISRVGTYQDAPFPVSWLRIKGGKAEVTNMGLLFDTNRSEWAGDIAERRILDMLPLDYEPTPLTENNNWKFFVFTQNTLQTQIVFESAPAPVVTIKHSFEKDTIVFHIQVKTPEGVPLRGRLSVAVIEDTEPQINKTDTLLAKNSTDDTTQIKQDSHSITLEEVKIKVKRNKNARHTMLGKIDYVVDSKELKDIISGNIITVLQNKVPGLEIYETIDNGGFSRKGVRMRGGGYGLRPTGAVEDEPLFLLDGIPYGTLQSLNAIPISEVLQIEVIKSANSLLGMRGKNGAINVVTKRAASNKDTQSASINEGKLFFWQPSTDLSPQGEAVVRMALPRGIKYYVTVNGITSENQPFTKEIRVY
ncbi:MAG: TonB-dependent receptor [Spirosomataceae bacterium]